MTVIAVLCAFATECGGSGAPAPKQAITGINAGPPQNKSRNIISACHAGTVMIGINSRNECRLHPRAAKNCNETPVINGICVLRYY